MNIERVDQCVLKLQDTLSALKELKSHLIEQESQDKVEKMESEVESVIEDIKEEVFESPEESPELVNEPPKAPVVDKPVTSQSEGEFEILKSLVNGNKWPRAVPNELICNAASEEDKTERAEGILELIVSRDLKGVNFLDMGCGEGHVAAKAAEKGASMSVGYDIKSPNKLDPQENLILTNDWSKVLENAPYEAVLIYDVLDHVSDETPVEVLERTKSVLSPTGKIYVRCHPWCGRHGAHLYRKLNKAFIHVVFTDEELLEMGIPNDEPNQLVKSPLAEYRSWFKNAKLKVVEENISSTNPEQFFSKTKEVSDRITKRFGMKRGKFPAFQMKQNFVDFIFTL